MNTTNPLLVRIGIAAGVLAVLVVTMYGLRFLIIGPELDGLGPTHRVVDESRYELDFTVSNTTRLAINDQEVVAQSGGEVEHVLYLAPGMNITQIDAYDPYGNHKRVLLYITYPQ